MEAAGTLARPTERPGRRAHRPAFIQRYWAFLSYCHQDEATAAWLQRELECFRVPKRLVGQGTKFGLTPSRLSPIFRDRYELAAGGDLRRNITDALASSRFLIVLCSPGAAKSRWTNEEIRLFKQLRPDGEVLAAIIEGEPWAADMPGREAEECFPPALKVEVDGDGTLNDEPTEPLAADLRPGKDGRQLGLLKLVAGMLDVGLDELVQRESHRRHRRMMAITAASLLGMVSASGLAFTAIQARDAARDQRREAEGLIGFMLGDLKDKLEPIGRLDALDAVGSRVLNYYRKQDQGALSDEGLAQRSRALTLMGEIATTRGDLGGALRRYREAMTATSELLRRQPGNPERLFDHAQNVFWVGDTALKRGQLAEAERQMRSYKLLAEQMVALDPGSEKYRQERKYADTNLGVMLLEQGRAGDAVGLFRSAVASSEVLLDREPDRAEFQMGLGETLAWLSDALLRSGYLDEAYAVRQRQLAFLRPLIARPASDVELRRQQAIALQRIATVQAMRGDVAGAAVNYRAALAENDALLAAEPESGVTASNGVFQRLQLAELLLATNRNSEAAALIETACSSAKRLQRRDSTMFVWRIEQPTDCLLAQARLAQAASDPVRAVSLARQALAVSSAEMTSLPNPRLRVAQGRASAVLGVLLAASSQPLEARAVFRRVLELVPSAGEPDLIAARLLAAEVVGGHDLAADARRRLSTMNYRHPWLARDRGVLAGAGLTS